MACLLTLGVLLQSLAGWQPGSHVSALPRFHQNVTRLGGGVGWGGWVGGGRGAFCLVSVSGPAFLEACMVVLGGRGETGSGWAARH